MDIFKVISAFVGIAATVLLALRFWIQKKSAELSKSQIDLLNKEKLFEAFEAEKFPLIERVKRETYFFLSYGIAMPEDAISMIFSNKKSTLFLESLELGIKKLAFDKRNSSLVLKYHNIDRWLEWGVFIFGALLILLGLMVNVVLTFGDYSLVTIAILFFLFLFFVLIGFAMFASALKGIVAYRNAYKTLELFKEMKNDKYSILSKEK